eukprot:746673-Hanusia_phi.AAC.2
MSMPSRWRMRKQAWCARPPALAACHACMQLQSTFSSTYQEYVLEVSEGSQLFEKGQACSKLFVLLEGSVGIANETKTSTFQAPCIIGARNFWTVERQQEVATTMSSCRIACLTMEELMTMVGRRRRAVSD